MNKPERNSLILTTILVIIGFLVILALFVWWSQNSADNWCNNQSNYYAKSKQQMPSPIYQACFEGKGYWSDL